MEDGHRISSGENEVMSYRVMNYRVMNRLRNRVMDSRIMNNRATNYRVMKEHQIMLTFRIFPLSESRLTFLFRKVGSRARRRRFPMKNSLRPQKRLRRINTLAVGG